MLIFAFSGSGNNGAAYLHSNYRNIGTREIAETTEIMQKLQHSFKFIDGNNTGIYGWSYGGFFALSALARLVVLNIYLKRCDSKFALLRNASFFVMKCMRERLESKFLSYGY